jgi:ATP/maltotriose-dependent transcriptional regulator MalT
MTLLTDHFVGRAEEIGSLDEVLAGLDEGGGAAIELVGEPGIGKTRLLAELGARADARGHLVLIGSASELERDLPFSLFVDALDEYVEGLDPRRLEALDEDVQAELAHVFPSLARLGSGREVALQNERYRAHRAVRELLEKLAATRPLVLVLDDLHWADSASVELVGALLRRRPAAAVLLALSFRPRQTTERLAAALERAQRAGTLERIQLGALTAVEARELLGEGVDASDATVLYEESGGNPFYLQQLARSLDRVETEQFAADVSLIGIGVPSAVAASLSEELAVLSNEARLVLEGAAVAGDPFVPELAAAAAATSEAAAMDAVDELLRLDLVRTTEVPRRFRFRHPLVRRAVYEATAAGWRLGAHERCAEALAARGASAGARAHHIERSAREGDVAAVRLLRQAGEEAARLAPESAARWYADALRLLPQSAPPQERVELLVARADALTAAGRFAESHDALLAAVDLALFDPKLARACAAVEGLLGKQEQAGARLVRAIEQLSDQDSAEAVALMVELVINLVWRARYEEMREWADRAVGAARRVGDRPLIATALAVLAMAETMVRQPERAESARSEAAAIVDSLPDDELAEHVEAPTRLAGTELYLDRYAEGDVHATRALALARATGQGELLLVLVQTLGGLRRMRGKLAESAELLDGALEAARLLDNTHALIWSLSGRSTAALNLGDIDLALATAQEAVELSEGLDEGFHSAESAVDLAAALFAKGQPEEAIELLLGSAGGEELVLIAGSPRARCLELLVRCRLALGHQPEAARAAEAAEAWASAVQLPLARAWAERAKARVDLDAGDASRAVERARASVAAAEEAGVPVEAARSRTVLGQALAVSGERERAVEELQRAAAELDARGARGFRDEAERELGKLGHRLHRRTRAGKSDGVGIESLTERERQVTRLVVDRKTNPEIAAELFLSQKTVESHLRNIFRKMNVSSRVALARAAENDLRN